MSAPRTLLLALVLLLASARAHAAAQAHDPSHHAPAGGDSAAVARTVEQFHRSLTAGDSAAVLALLSPDVVIQESGGQESRAEYRSHHLAADIEFARAVRTQAGPV